MKLLWRYAVVVAALMAASLLLAACAEEEVAAPTTATPTATPTGGEEEPLPPTPTPTPAPETPAGGADPQDFGEFADLAASAVAEQDTAFFADRVKGRTHTCTEIDVSGGALGGPAPDVCQEVGQEVEVVELWYWHSEGVSSRPEALVKAIEEYFSDALPDQDDDYGTGAVQLYAIGQTPSAEPGRTYRAAILTAITPRGEGPASEPVRTARGIHFDYVEGRWVIVGMLTANVLAEELLSPQAAPYDEWEKH